MIFTRRFGALAARPKFEHIDPDLELQREIDELLRGADLEPAADQRAS